MKVKKFFAPDIRQAIRMVRDEQGPDAVILSNRRVDGGVEIVAATEYSESLFNNMQAADEQKPQRSVQAPRPERPERQSAGINKYLEFTDDDQDAESMMPTPPKREPEPRVELRSPMRVEARPEARAEPKREIRAEPKVDLRAEIRAESHAPNTHDPLLVQVRNELATMRAYLETQIADIAWSHLSRRSPLQAEIIKRGVQFGLSHELAREMANFAQHAVDIDVAWSACLSRLATHIPVTNDDMISHGGIVALVGPTGVGKTTTVAKLAARYAMRHGVRRIALITTDDYRVGAHEQLRTYGRLLDIPVRNASNAEELQAQLNDLSDKELVFIDTAGISQRDIRLTEQLSVLQDTKFKIKAFLVLAANAQASSVEEAIHAFKKVQLDGCILTKVDEACVLGGVLSSVIQSQLPITYFSDGQRVPEDLHLARADKLVMHGAALMAQRPNVDDEEMHLAADGRTLRNAH